MSDQSMDIYTLGIWMLRSGRENEFINEWSRFAKSTSKNTEGNGKAYLLQDEKNPSRFISFGPWQNMDAIKKWRDSEEFKNFVAIVKDLCIDFQPNTMREVATSQ